MTRGSWIQGGGSASRGSASGWGGLHPGGLGRPPGLSTGEEVGQTPPLDADPLRYMYTIGYGQQAGGTQPTGMHPCSYCC